MGKYFYDLTLMILSSLLRKNIIFNNSSQKNKKIFPNLKIWSGVCPE